MLRYVHLGELLRDPQFFQLIPAKIPGLWRTALVTDHAVDLSDDGSLEAANNFLFRQPFCGAPSDVGFGALVEVSQVLFRLSRWENLVHAKEV